MKPPFQSPAVAQKFSSYVPAMRERMLELRTLIFQTAAQTAGVGPLQETLKWGEPAYLTASTGAGSTVRIDCKPGQADRRGMCCAMYFNCQTPLVESFRCLFPNDFVFEGRRALIFDAHTPLPRDALAFCIAAALTYHRSKNLPRG